MKISSVLIVDDNEADVYLVRRMLKKAKLCEDIFDAENGKSALDFLANYAENNDKYPASFPPELILLDINMPLVNGFQFLEEFELLRQNNDYCSCILMMFSSSENEKDKKQALAYDFVSGYITKMPESAEILKNEIERNLL